MEGGSLSFVERHGVDARKVVIACGQCIGCRLERSRQWAVRCVHESQMFDHSVFITLTYDDDHLGSPSLVYRDFQLFMKRLRKVKLGVRFYMCGEYGGDNGRPHFHACLFNCFFPDRSVFKVMPSGATLYTSGELSGLWPYGFSSIGDLTFESAAYVARYCMKKMTGRDASDYYRVVDPESGECVDRVPEFNKMSLKPGIGANWFDKYISEVYPRDFVVVNGVKMKPPKYYDTLLSRELSSFGSRAVGAEIDLEFERYVKAARCEPDNTPDRLAVREVVTKARLSTKKRSL